jgi:SnoaL-like domain
MNMTVQQIAAAFSGGRFEEVYPFLAENVLWNIIGENSFAGKKAVMDNCEQVAAYFKTVTTNFSTDNVIAGDNRVAIDGTAEFLKNGKRVVYVWACDVYEFNDKKELEKITSYCIQDKQ